MCLIMYSKNKNNIKKDWFKNSMESNQDGVGFMYPKDGRLVIKKAIKNELDEFNKVMKEIDKKTPIAIHQRYGTSGIKTVLNVHPFQILNKDEGDSIDLAVMHNGILSIENVKDYSDTVTFVEYVLKPMLKKDNTLLKSESFQLLLDMAIGNDKLLFMDNNGEVTIIGENRGEWKNNVWLSSPHYIEKYCGFTNLTYKDDWWSRYYKDYDDQDEDFVGCCCYCGEPIFDKDGYEETIDGLLCDRCFKELYCYKPNK